MEFRESILSLLRGDRTSPVPAFSGLIHVTSEGLQNEGITLHEAHHNPQTMARAAASTFRLTGMPSAALPLDLCAPAEALGSPLNFYEGVEDRFPQPARPLFASTTYMSGAYFESANFLNRGRLPLICDAIQRLKQEVGDQVVISGVLPGPYTLLLYLIEPGGLFAEMKREPGAVQDALFHLASFLSQIAHAYREAGADFITIHDMGGSPGFLGPAKFEQYVFPALKKLIAELPGPVVLSVCGNTNKSMHLLAETGAQAISVDQVNDLAASRHLLRDTLLFGNIDPVGTLWQGNNTQVTEAVRRGKEAGVDAVWPGCDLVPGTPVENIRAFVEASKVV
ncbi:MAG TPA: uroporphyrinogen decarboxylase family protein [Anaerolineales bacterium]|nr:uroporphyrinogen decarboxylase family protein [Anaerolineales bacterium]